MGWKPVIGDDGVGPVGMVGEHLSDGSAAVLQPEGVGVAGVEPDAFGSHVVRRAAAGKRGTSSLLPNTTRCTTGWAVLRPVPAPASRPTCGLTRARSGWTPGRAVAVTPSACTAAIAVVSGSSPSS